MTSWREDNSYRETQLFNMIITLTATVLNARFIEITERREAVDVTSWSTTYDLPNLMAGFSPLLGDSGSGCESTSDG